MPRRISHLSFIIFHFFLSPFLLLKSFHRRVFFSRFPINSLARKREKKRRKLHFSPENIPFKRYASSRSRCLHFVDFQMYWNVIQNTENIWYLFKCEHRIVTGRYPATGAVLHWGRGRGECNRKITVDEELKAKKNTKIEVTWTEKNKWNYDLML